MSKIKLPLPFYIHFNWIALKWDSKFKKEKIYWAISIFEKLILAALLKIYFRVIKSILNIRHLRRYVIYKLSDLIFDCEKTMSYRFEIITFKRKKIKDIGYQSMILLHAQQKTQKAIEQRFYWFSSSQRDSETFKVLVKKFCFILKTYM